MTLRLIEFFGFAPLDPAARPFVEQRRCPFTDQDCTKPEHGGCSARAVKDPSPVIFCPMRMYGDGFRALADIAEETFGVGMEMLRPAEVAQRRHRRQITGREIAVFGRYWGNELPLPTPPGGSTGKFYVDWVLAKINARAELEDMIAVEVQTIDTTGNYRDQAESFFEGQPFTDAQNRTPGFSDAGFNWENVNKRILPQLIYKGHVLRRESTCKKGLFFVCPRQVYDRIRGRLGGDLHDYDPGQGTITFRSYDLGDEEAPGRHRTMRFAGQFTTTVDQVALAFTSPQNLPERNVYAAAINKALSD